MNEHLDVHCMLTLALLQEDPDFGRRYLLRLIRGENPRAKMAIIREYREEHEPPYVHCYARMTIVME